MTPRPHALAGAAALALLSCAIPPLPASSETPVVVSPVLRVQQEQRGRARVFVACVSCVEPTPKTLPSIALAAAASAGAAAAPIAAAIAASAVPPRQPTVAEPQRATAEPARSTSPIVETTSVTFPFGSAELTPAARGHLKSLVPLLRQASRVRITAYTDDQGPTAPNEKLAEARAFVVMRHVRDLLVDAHGNAAVSAAGRALCCYVASNRDAADRALNRRAELAIELGPASRVANLASRSKAEAERP